MSTLRITYWLAAELHLAKWFCKFRLAYHGTQEWHIFSVFRLRLNDGSLWQQKETPRGVSWARHNSSDLSWVVKGVGFDGVSRGHWHIGSDKLLLAISLTGIFSGTLTNDTMPLRQRGQETEPGGPPEIVVPQFAEQRYKAHFVQNSWSQPAGDWTSYHPFSLFLFQKFDFNFHLHQLF